MYKRIGIVAGAGPEAGIDIWKKILLENRKILGERFRGDIDAPHIVIHSVPQLGLAMNFSSHEDDLWLALKNALIAMDGQIDLVCIACNALHAFTDRIYQLNLNMEFVSIIDVVKEHVVSQSLGTLGLLSISAVMSLNPRTPYAPLQEITSVVTAPNHGEMDALIRAIKLTGEATRDLQDQYESIVRRMNVEHVVLACTELPLVMRPILGITQIDASQLLANALANKRLGR